VNETPPMILIAPGPAGRVDTTRCTRIFWIDEIKWAANQPVQAELGCSLGQHMSALPEGCTDDFRIQITPGSEVALVDFVFTQLLAFTDANNVCSEVRARFQLSEDDAR